MNILPDSTGETPKVLDVLKLARSPTVPYIVRCAAYETLTQDYFTVKSFLDILSDYELSVVLSWVESTEIYYTPDYSNLSDEDKQKHKIQMHFLSTLCILLHTAEGHPGFDTEYILKGIPVLSTILRVERLHRLGTMKVYRDNYSMTELDKPIIDEN